MKPNRKSTLIESDEFPFEFLSRLAERESWRKEVHRPIYHVHKWWAKRLGSVFRGILLGAVLPDDADLAHEFYQTHSLHRPVSVRSLHGFGHHDRRSAQTRNDRARSRHQSRGGQCGDYGLRRLGPAHRQGSLPGACRGNRQGPAGTVPLRRLQGPAVRRALSLLGDAGELPSLCQTRSTFFPPTSLPGMHRRGENRRSRSLCPSCGDIFPGSTADDPRLPAGVAATALISPWARRPARRPRARIVRAILPF